MQNENTACDLTPVHQFQQVAAAEGGTGTEAPSPAADRRERENGKVAVHAAVRGTDR